MSIVPVLLVEEEAYLSGAVEIDDEELVVGLWKVETLMVADLPRRLLRQPPPTGTLRREPPLVQYLLQPLQKYLG